ncbi:MAG: hypothetical protein QW559_02165 [Candidatus Woesearchaeota archaeon]
MIDKKTFELMRQKLEAFDYAREELIKKSRDILKESKKAIYALHREDLASAAAALRVAKSRIKEAESLVKGDKHLAMIGAYAEALEEYVEASCYYGWASEKRLFSPKELGVDIDIYLLGLCDMVGELVRKAINSVIKGNERSALEIKAFVEGIHEQLTLFDFRNQPLRKKFDSLKYGLEKLEDLALKLRLKGRSRGRKK